MTVINVVLDPLLIFGIGPFPELGMQGAALATVIAVVAACWIGFYELAFKEKFLLPFLPKWKEFKTSIRNLLEIAIPAVLANVIIPLTAAFITVLVAKFGADAVAGYGVGTRVEMVSLMLVYALSSTLPMFIGQNLGAQRKDRVYAAIKISFRFVVIFQLAMYLVLLVSARSIAELFSQQQSVIQTISGYLWIVPLSYGLSGIVVLINVAMNVLGKPRLALYINLSRLILFYFPLAYLGAYLYQIKGLFIGIALGNCCTFVVAIWLLSRTLKEMDIKAPTS
jgi:putative MATE family efflux protein